MAKATTDAVQILRFFETEPIEKAEIVFRIVADKMRERLGTRHAETHAAAKESAATRKRREESRVHASGAEEQSAQNPGA